MDRQRAPRLKSFRYIGRYHYFLTICAHTKTPVFTDDDIVTALLLRFRESAAAHRFANHAYCFMPDHAHFVLEGQSTGSNLCELIRLWKSTTGFQYKRATGQQLWQRGFYDHLLRTPEDVAAAAMYVLENPVRAGLASERRAYPFLGSDTTTIEAVLKHGREVRAWYRVPRSTG